MINRFIKWRTDAAVASATAAAALDVGQPQDSPTSAFQSKRGKILPPDDMHQNHATGAPLA